MTKAVRLSPRSPHDTLIFISSGIPLSYLLRTSTYLAGSHTENALVKAARTHLAESVEVRIRVAEPDESAWDASGPSNLSR